MMNMLVVIGGAGFIGSHFVRMVFDKAEARVVVVGGLTHATER